MYPRFSPAGSRRLVAMQAGAVDDEIASKFPAVVRTIQPAGAAFRKRGDTGARHHLAAAALNLPLDHLADPGIINNPLLRHAQGSHAADMRLKLPHLLEVEQFPWPCRPFCCPRSCKLRSLGNSDSIHGHAELAADFIADGNVFAAKRNHFLDAGDREFRLG